MGRIVLFTLISSVNAVAQIGSFHSNSGRYELRNHSAYERLNQISTVAAAAGIDSSSHLVADEFTSTIIVQQIAGFINACFAGKPVLPTVLRQNNRHAMMQVINGGMGCGSEDGAGGDIEIAVVGPKPGKQKRFLIWQVNVVGVLPAIIRLGPFIISGCWN